ncbi:MAG: hypothetical protein ABSG26_26625 [Bryobacteraceae bacterium]|jgi:hypothetical protein
MVERREDLGNAIALNSSMVNGARLIGPASAGVVPTHATPFSVWHCRAFQQKI